MCDCHGYRTSLVCSLTDARSQRGRFSEPGYTRANRRARFFDVVSSGAHPGLIVLPASSEVCVGLNWDTACVAAQQYAAINPIEGFC
jgi:hypothetical protein